MDVAVAVHETVIDQRQSDRDAGLSHPERRGRWRIDEERQVRRQVDREGGGGRGVPRQRNRDVAARVVPVDV